MNKKNGEKRTIYQRTTFQVALQHLPAGVYLTQYLIASIHQGGGVVPEASRSAYVPKLK
jgi:hypothetical protein